MSWNLLFNFKIHTDNKPVISQICVRLRTGFHNNYNAKLAKLRKAKKSYNLFDNYNLKWLNTEFQICLNTEIGDEHHEPGKYIYNIIMNITLFFYTHTHTHDAILKAWVWNSFDVIKS